MSKKKKYTEPKIFRVQLNQSQAILAVCHAGSEGKISSGDYDGYCKHHCKAYKKAHHTNSAANS